MAHGKSLKERIYDAQGNIIKIDQVDFGGKFEVEANKYLQAQENSCSAHEKVHEMKQGCHMSSTEAVGQVDKRLPDAKHLFKRPSSLHPSKVLSQNDRSPCNSLPFPHLRNECAEKIEKQYRKILFRDWKEEAPFNGTVPDDAVQFWCGISQFRNALNQNPFQSLAKYALACHTNPVSNAVVERTFSEVTAIKTKTRNRIGLELLSALVRIRNEFHMRGGCCHDLTVAKRMLEMFNSEQMYNDSAKTAFTDNADEVFSFKTVLLESYRMYVAFQVLRDLGASSPHSQQIVFLAWLISLSLC